MRISDWSSDVCSSDLVRECCLELVDARALDLVQVFEDPTAQRQAVTQTPGELGEREKAHVLVYRATLLAHVLLGHEAKAHVLLATSGLEPLGFTRAHCPPRLPHPAPVPDAPPQLPTATRALTHPLPPTIAVH